MRTVYLPIGKKIIDGVESDGACSRARKSSVSAPITRGLSTWTRRLTLQPDYIIEVDNKSLTHRPDLWGHYGMAREVAAILGKTPDRSRERRNPCQTALPPIRVTIEDYSLCPRYSALVFENVTIRPSPLWLQYRLEAIGLNPINNLVDVTNFVMAELAQPMHALRRRKTSRRSHHRTRRASRREIRSAER